MPGNRALNDRSFPATGLTGGLCFFKIIQYLQEQVKRTGVKNLHTPRINVLTQQED